MDVGTDRKLQLPVKWLMHRDDDNIDKARIASDSYQSGVIISPMYPYSFRPLL